MFIIFWISFVLICYIFIGYYGLLFISTKIKQLFKKEHIAQIPSDFKLKVSVIIAAHNEEKNISKRIDNLLAQNYPMSHMEIIIASDGSTDQTVAQANKYSDAYSNVVVLDFKENRGRAYVHNEAAKISSSDILLFTDASTTFDSMFVHHINKAFFDKNIACASGRLYFRDDKSYVSQSEGLYWRMETKIRQLENELGIFASATGACIAVRRKNYLPLALQEDIDDSIPIYSVFSGHRVALVFESIAYDNPNVSLKHEFRARIRMTAKGITGIILRCNFIQALKYPLVTVGILSHKVLRWCTIYLLLLLLLSNIFIASTGFYYFIFLLCQLICYSFVVYGLISNKKDGSKFIMISLCTSLIVSMVGMGIGFFKGLIGKAPQAYMN